VQAAITFLNDFPRLFAPDVLTADEAQERAGILPIQRVEEARALPALAVIGCCFDAVAHDAP
jgi:hypothetical protein